MAGNAVYDYLVFAAFIVSCSLINIYHNFTAPKKQTKAEYVFAAGTGVSMGAMMLSIARGTLGVRSFLGYPSELYYRGSAMWETLYGMILAYPIVCFVFVPVYYSLGITSVYQYLDLRFKSRFVRQLASMTYIIRSFLNLGVTVFTPCVALKTVIGLPYWASILGIVIISVIFNIMGGLKAAIASDVFQLLSMMAVSLAIIIQGTWDTPGFLSVIETSAERDRLKFFNFDMDPTIRVATVSALFGQLFMSLSIFGCQQNFVQRYCSMSSQSKVTRTLMFNIPVITVLFSSSWIVGMVIFANYANCDPLLLGYINKIDEIVPFFVENKFTHVPGLLGLFMATLFNGALSLLTSNLNSLATVTWEDFLNQIPRLKTYSDKYQLYVIKFVGAVYGAIIVGIALGVGTLSGVIESSMLMTSATSGPLLGVFVMALLIPCTNRKGAAWGMILGHAITIWITCGNLSIEKSPTTLLPLTTDGCTNDSFSNMKLPTNPSSYSYRIIWTNHTDPNFNSYFNYTTEETLQKTSTPPEKDFLTSLYSITYMFYSLIGCGVTVISGIIISYFSGSTKDDIYDENLIHPIALKISRWFPGEPRKYSEPRKFSVQREAPVEEMRNGIKERYTPTVELTRSKLPP